MQSTEDGYVKFKPDETLKLTCEVAGGRPKANITWTFSTNPKTTKSQAKLYIPSTKNSNESCKVHIF